MNPAMRRRLSILIVLAAALVAAALWSSEGDGVSSRRVDSFGDVAVTSPSRIDSSPDAAATTITTPTATVPARGGAAPATVVAGANPASPPQPAISVRSGAFTGDASSVQRPVHLWIPALGVDAPIEEVGYDAARAEMEVPRSASTVGWYGFGPAPGEAGSAVLAAHVDWNGRPGPFFDLYAVTAGTRVEVEFSDGSRQSFLVTSLDSYEKELLPTDGLFRRDGTAVLTLITCGGDFDARARSYRDNVVVQAVPVGPETSLEPTITPG